MIRTILILLYLVLFLILGIPVLFVEWIIGHFNQDLKDRSSLALVQWGFRCCLFTAGTKITVLGKENIPKDTAVLYVANHRSYFDILINYTLVPRLTGFISKKEMKRVPLLSLWMKNVHCLFLDRHDIKQGMQTILAGIEKVKSGISIFIFPEGTRNREEGTFLDFKGGSFKIAEKSGCPIIPVAINNSGAIFEDHIPYVCKTHVVVEYGKPILPSSLAKEERKLIPQMAKEQIVTMFEKNKSLLSS